MATDQHQANTNEVNRSIDEWRASQGLPAINRDKKERSLEASVEQTKPKKGAR